MNITLHLFLPIFGLLSAFSIFAKCEPENENFSIYSGFTEEEIKLTCTPLRNGDLIEKCNGEACDILDYSKAVKDVKVYSKPDKNSVVIGEVKRCDVLKDFKIVSVFREYGKIEVLTDLDGYQLKKGDTFNFTWTQEGSHYGCINGKTVVVHGHGVRDLNESCFYHLKNSVLEKWVRHRASNGKIGYSKVERNPFYIPYAGREESLLCPEDRKKRKDEWHPPITKESVL